MLFLVNVGWLVHIVMHILSERARFADLFQAFQLEVPLLTRMVIDVADWGIIAAGLGVFVFLATKELILPWRSVRFALNLAVLVGLILLVELFYQAVTAPLIDQLKALAIL